MLTHVILFYNDKYIRKIFLSNMISYPAREEDLLVLQLVVTDVEVDAGVEEVGVGLVHGHLDAVARLHCAVVTGKELSFYHVIRFGIIVVKYSLISTEIGAID